jgi:tripartite ATP-independent transporter DctP family solute receptor
MMTPTHAWTIAEQGICKEIAAKSNGRITVEPYAAGALGTQQEGIEMQKNGDLAFITSGPAIFSSYVPQAQVFTFPYLFKDREHVRRIIKAPVIQKMFNEEILSKAGVRTIAWWFYGTRNLTTKNTKAMVPADISKLKIRCLDTPAGKSVVKALGGNPIPIAFNELYFALQTGVVDGQENPITTIYDKKFNEVQKYLIMTEHNIHMGTVHVSEKVWQKFPDADKKLIMEVVDKYTAEVDKLIDQQTNDNLKEMVAKGLEVVKPDWESFRKYAIESIRKDFKDDPKWATVFDQILAVN